MPLDRDVDDETTVHHFMLDEILVVCPRCTGRAVIVPAAMNPRAELRVDRRLWNPRRLVCPGCGLHEDKAIRSLTVADGRDPFFGRDLWLRTGVRGRTLWAYDAAHLDRIEDFVGARLRERPRPGPGRRRPVRSTFAFTMRARLPVWIKDAKNREAVLAGVERLRRRL